MQRHIELNNVQYHFAGKEVVCFPKDTMLDRAKE